MKIAFSGTSGTGKTTLVNAMREMDEFKDFEFQTNLTRRLINMGIEINENGGDEATLGIIDIHREVLTYKDVVADRSILDAAVYGIYSYIHGKLSDDTLIKLITALYRYIYTYDVIFFIEPEFDLVADGVRSDSEEYRFKINQIFKIVLQMIDAGRIYKLTGSVEDRLKQIKEVLNV